MTGGPDSPGQVGRLLTEPLLGAQVHALRHVLHGSQLHQQTQVQQGEHQQAGGGGGGGDTVRALRPRSSGFTRREGLTHITLIPATMLWMFQRYGAFRSMEPGTKHTTASIRNHTKSIQVFIVFFHINE